MSGVIVPIGTIAYRRLDRPPAGGDQHGIAGPHHNLYRANQAPRHSPQPCKCFWQSIGAVRASELPEAAIPIEPFLDLADDDGARTMKYPDGQEVRLGDRVKLGHDEGGIVVASIDTKEYSSAHPAAQWRYLKRGVMIEFPRYGLIHYEEPEPDLQLIARAPAREKEHRPSRG